MSPDDRRAMIIAATEPLLREHGRAVSTKQIAEAAGVAEGTIFRVFDNKQALIDAVLEQTFSSEITRQQLREIDLDLDLRARLIATARVLQERMIGSFTLMHAIGPPAEPKEEDRRKFRDRMTADAELLQDAIVELIGADAGRLLVDTPTAAHLLRATVFALSHPMVGWLHGFGTEHPEPEAIVDILFYGIDTEGPPENRIDLKTSLATLSLPGCGR